MPNKARSFKGLRSSARTHQPAETKRLTRQERGYDERWLRYRKWYLANHPICVDCGRPANEVDHIVPLSHGGAHYDEINSQALCKSCHSRKTVRDKMLRSKPRCKPWVGGC